MSSKSLALTGDRSDIFGAAASALCMIHCLATPFLFVAQAGVYGHSHHGAPGWWGAIDVTFLVISFVAVYQTAKHTSKSWIKYALSTSWLLLALFICNEQLEMVHLPHDLINLPAAGLVFFHLYNRRFCQCADEDCCLSVSRTQS